jgi:hypothetical protein
MVNRNPVAEGILFILFAAILPCFSLLRIPGDPVGSCFILIKKGGTILCPLLYLYVAFKLHSSFFLRSVLFPLMEEQHRR